jgi:hypothetical protein
MPVHQVLRILFGYDIRAKEKSLKGRLFQASDPGDIEEMEFYR